MRSLSVTRRSMEIWKSGNRFAHGAQERRLVMFERTLSNEFGLDAFALTIMAQCIP